MSKNIEVEGGEIAIQNESGDIAIIPIKDVSRVKKMLKNPSELDNYVATLPKMSDYAEDGSFIDKRALTSRENIDLTKEKENYTREELLSFVDEKRKLERGESFKPMNVTDSLNLKNVAHMSGTRTDDVLESLADLPTFDVIGEKEKDVFKEAKTKDEIKSIQKEMLEKGFYEDKLINLDEIKDNDKEAIRKFQKKLKDSGYSMKHSIDKNQNLDGVLGEKTLRDIKDYNKKLYNKEVDGIIGSRSKAASERYINSLTKDENFEYGNIQKIDSDIDSDLLSTGLKKVKNIDSRQIGKESDLLVKTVTKAELDQDDFKYTDNRPCGDTNECAKHVNNKLEKDYGIPGLSGNAWNNMKTTPSYYSIGYKALDKKPVIENPTKENINKELEKHLNYTEEEKEQIRNAPPTSIVNIYNPNSSFTVKAYNEGNTTLGTHTGFVVIKDGKKYIEHEIGGSAILTPIEKLISGEYDGMKIMAVDENTKYKDKESINNYKYIGDVINLEASTQINPSRIGSKEANIAHAKSLDYANQFKPMFNLSNENANNLAKATTLIINQESAFGKNDALKYDINPIKRIGEAVGYGEISRGYSQFKLDENLSLDMQNKLGVTKELLEDRSQKGLDAAVKVTQYKLLKNYKKLSDIVYKNKDIKLSNKEIWQLAIKGYNFNIDGVVNSLVKYKTMDKIEEAYKKQAEAKGNTYSNYPPVYNFGVINL
jgi:hypothetical protein